MSRRVGPTAAADDLVAAVDTHLATLVDAPPSRAGNVLNVSLLRKDEGGSHLLLFGVDIGGVPRNEEQLAALSDTAAITDLGCFTQQPLTDV
ncbi:hypothetical protein [Kitasatospora sp. GP82]|uniref:hypothetical protein n=1 Tax=Kitasatospora sp. GP82 TaxID=3035089 RepID=UPI0024738CF1|nr:hypothetical protein [Kitasatospora sp. GP82]MDH6128268.1 hypothetical protein [Kitasatospora sp. GP82]